MGISWFSAEDGGLIWFDVLIGDLNQRNMG